MSISGKRPRSIAKCKNRDEFMSATKRQGGEFRQGRHVEVCKPPGRKYVQLPRTSKDYGTGLRHGIKNQLLAIGFVVLPFICLLAWLGKGISEVSKCV